MAMIDLIRQSAVPANLMRAAANGSLSLPPGETLEILVFLANHPVFGEQAGFTLASWDESSVLAVLADRQASPAIAEYYSVPANLRPNLARALLDHPAMAAERMMEWAHSAPRSVLNLMMSHPRVRALPEVVRALLVRPELVASERVQLEAALEAMGALVTDSPGQEVLEPELLSYLSEHATEIAAEEDKPFHLIDWTAEEQAEMASPAAPKAPPATVSAGGFAARALGLAGSKDSEMDRPSPIQKISRMTVGGRIQLAYRGTKDERLILVRDGARVVCCAVLDSPKLTDQEVESFAAMKNVSEHVLRTISMKRKFMRNYAMKRVLTSNPRCPIDVCLPLVKELLLMDLKRLMINKNVSDTVRSFAAKVFKEKKKD